MRSRRLLGTALGLGVTLVTLAAVLDDAEPTELDRQMRRRARRGPRLRRLAVIVGSPGYPALFFPISAGLAWWMHRRGLQGARLVIGAAVGGWATHRAVKLFVRRRRPRTMRGRSNEFEAFPSGHTTAATAIALTTAYVLARQRTVEPLEALGFGVSVPLIIGLCRVAADEHWTTDVIGGWIGGAAVAAGAAALLEQEL
jgi:undecaprenyl-diphosphatase